MSPLFEEDPNDAWGGAEGTIDDGGAPQGTHARPSASTVLVEIALELFDVKVSDAGEPFAVPKAGPQVVAMLRGGKTPLRSLLAKHYYTRCGKAAPQQALADALLVIDGLAQDHEPSPLELRVARRGDALWLDLGDQLGRAVRIDSAGWRVEDTPPVLFRRTALNAALPDPVRGGSIEELWSFVNVAEDDRPLVLAWLVAALDPNIPHPPLDLEGEQGSGKTSLEKIVVSIIDPSPVPTRKPPRDAESWVTAASGSWVVGLDNLSAMPDWLSDSLCRAVTGDGDVRRRLYTDGDFTVFAFKRAVILTGIDLGALNGDLADRLLPVHLDVIPSERRLEENELWPRWEAAHPRILGALLDVQASVARVLPSVRLGTKTPRMADFAKVLAAVDVVLGTDGLNRYLTKQGALATESIEADIFITAMTKYVMQNGTFNGSAAELLIAIGTPERPPKGWPADPRRVTQQLHRQAPVLRKIGWTVENDGGANKTHATRWTITPPSPEITRNPTSPSSPTSLEQVTGDVSIVANLAEASMASQHSSPLTRKDEPASMASNDYGPSQVDERMESLIDEYDERVV